MFKPELLICEVINMPVKNEIGNIYGYLTVISRAERLESAKQSSHSTWQSSQLRSLVANQIFYYIIFQFKAFPQMDSQVVYFPKVQKHWPARHLP